MTARRLASAAWGTLIAAAVALGALYVGQLAGPRQGGFLPGSFLTHSFMLLASVGIIWLWPGRGFADFGFARGTYRFRPRILLWVLPTAALSLMSMLASTSGEGHSVIEGRTQLQLVVFVWLYASVCEEVLARGLLQSLVAGPDRVLGDRRTFSMPILMSALFFGAMHLVLIGSMGPAAGVSIVLATLLGYVAARYRASTGSLIPAIMVHALFNVGGMLPGWVVGWFGRG